MRWLGVWALMTVYPVAGKRRTHWRGVLKFGQFMPEKRFENILRAFTLPMYKYTDEEWGGPGREEYEEKKFDPFFATRKFSDQMRSRFQNAMKPGGWLIVHRRVYVQLAGTGTEVTRVESHQKKTPSYWVRIEDHCLLSDGHAH